MTTAPAATIITPAATGMPAIVSYSGGEVAVDTPLGQIHTPVEVTLVGISLDDIRGALESFAHPDPSTGEALQDFPSWKANGRQVQTFRVASPNKTLVDARVVATSLNEGAAILGALFFHGSFQLTNNS
ncbi:hypothetical protein LG293_16935 (plasmid) [Citricoccus nitrophenolicus]